MVFGMVNGIIKIRVMIFMNKDNGIKNQFKDSVKKDIIMKFCDALIPFF